MVANPLPPEKKKNGMDFNFYINQMIMEDTTNKNAKSQEQEKDLPFHVFKKRPYI